MFSRYLFLICFLLFNSLFSANAALLGDTSFKKKSSKFIILPAIIKTPETKLGFGAASSVFFKTSKSDDTLIRTSNVEGLGLYTLNKQILTVLNTNIYFPKEKFIFRSSYSFSKFPDKFWGLGDYTPNSNLEHYIYRQYLLFQQLQRKIYKKFYAGGLWEFQNVFSFQYNAGGLFDQENIQGRHGSVVSGLGINLAWDNRNNAFSSTKGEFAQFSYTFFAHAFGSEYNFGVCNIDVRKYIKTYHSQILAFQFVTNLTHGDVPIRNLSVLGGSNIMRGYYQGRYRDKDMLAFQGEYRIPLLKRVGMVLFAGWGEVSPALKNFSFFGLKYSTGGGIRIALKEKERLNLRLDYGFGYHSSGAYIMVSEAF